jgi:hypothetical protein
LKLVNTVWVCKTLAKSSVNKYFVYVSEDAVYDFKNGWICDCGHWTTGNDEYHIPIAKGRRAVFEKNTRSYL